MQTSKNTSRRSPSHRPGGLAPAQRPAAPADLRRFEPTSSAALGKVRELVARGAALAAVTRTVVTVTRMGQTATIDHAGRVEWLQCPLAASPIDFRAQAPFPPPCLRGIASLHDSQINGQMPEWLKGAPC